MSARLTVSTAEDVRDVRLTVSDGGRVHFVDFVREIATEATTTTPAASAPAAAARPNPNVTAGAGIRVIVIDAGHGGIESGATNAGTLEKDLTLALARRLRTALQSRLTATVVLTRDADVELTSEARAAVANNNQAGLLISLHTGFSPDKAASGSSIYVMTPDFTGGLPRARRRQDVPALVYGLSNPCSREQVDGGTSATQPQSGPPGWKFPIRHGPLGVLASATMPAIALEIGNLNNDVSVKTLTDPDFQTNLTATIAASIEQFAVGGRK